MLERLPATPSDLPILDNHRDRKGGTFWVWLLLHLLFVAPSLRQFRLLSVLDAKIKCFRARERFKNLENLNSGLHPMAPSKKQLRREGNIYLGESAQT